MFPEKSVARRLVSLFGLVLFAAVLGCGGGSPGGGDVLYNIAISADSMAVTAGSSTQLHATERQGSVGMGDVTSSASWTSSNASVATVSSTGLLTALQAGATTITAKTSDAVGTFSITIGAPPVTQLVVSPASATLYSSGTQQFSATASYANGTTGDVSSAVQWSVTPTTVASISASGLLTPAAPGSFVVLAKLGGQAAAASGTVSSATLTSVAITPANPSVTGGSTLQLTATGTYSDGTTQNISKAVTWTSSNAAVLAVDSNGLATAAASSSDATVTVTAQQGSVQVSAQVQVKASATLTSLIVEPTSSSIASGTAEQHTATAVYSDGSLKDVTNQVTWSVASSVLAGRSGGLQANAQPGSQTSSQTGSQTGPQPHSTSQVATVTPAGVDWATAPGSAMLQASLGSATAQSVVLVTPATLVSLHTSSTTPYFPVGSVQPVMLTGTFSDGTLQDLTLSATWTSSDPSVATVSASGQVTGVGQGTVVITAKVGGLTATQSLQVLSRNLVNLMVNLQDAALPQGAVQQVSVVGTYSDGSSQDLTTLATFSSSDPTVLPISSTGFLQALNPGSAQVTAKVGSLSALAAVYVAPASLASLVVYPPSPSVALGTTLPMQAVGTFTTGLQVDLSQPSVWTSSDPTVLTVDSNGVIKPGKVGTATVTASVLGQTATSATIHVSNATMTHLLIKPNGGQVAATTGAHFTAVATFSDGTLQDLTSNVTWSTTNNLIASADPTGRALGVSAGKTEVIASIFGKQVRVPFTVTNATLLSVALAPGNTEVPVSTAHQFVMIGSFSDGTTQQLQHNVVWTSPTPSIVSVHLQGEVLGISPGLGAVSAQRGYFSATTPVNVTNATLQSIALTPASNTLHQYQTQQLTATGTFSDGFSEDLYLNTRFSSGNNFIAVPVDPTGLIFAPGLGSTQVTAFVGAVSATSSFTVNSGKITSLSTSPSSPVIVAGNTLQFTTTAKFADGTSANVSPNIFWTSSNLDALTVDENGLATAHPVSSATQVTLTGQYGNASFMVTVTVEPTGYVAPTPSSITVTPANAGVAVGSTTQLIATASYPDGTTQDISSQAVWSSSNSAIATVSSTGLVSGVAAGNATISAQIGSVSGTDVVTVGSGSGGGSGSALSSLKVTPLRASVVAGGTVQLTATATYADGSTADVTNQATWTSGNAATATVNGTGLVTGVAAGTAPVQAQISSQSGTVSSSSVITVSAQAPTLTSLKVTPLRASVAAGATVQLSATGTYSDGSTADVSGQATWTSSNPATATVNGTGLVTGVAAGTTPVQAQIGSGSGAMWSSSVVTVTAPASTTPTLTGMTVVPTSSHLAAGTSTQLSARGTYSDGSVQDLSTQATWTSADTSKATVNSTGLATGVAPGLVNVQAQVGAYTSTSILNVSNATLVSVAISPSGASFASGTTQRFTLTGTFSDGTTQDLSTAATWSSSAPSVATIDGTGLATGKTPGSVAFTASYNGQTATTPTVTVTPATLVSIAVNPSSPSFAKGTLQQFTVLGTFSDGTTEDLTGLATFTSSAPSVVSIAGNGLATGLTTGTAQITVAVGGQTATTSSVTVTPATLVSLSVTPTNPNIPNGSTQQFTAVGTFSDGTTQDLSSQVVWTSSNPQVLTVSGSGLAESAAQGAAQLTAALNGVTFTTGNLQVTAAALTGVTVTPHTASFAKGTTQQFTATGSYTDGSQHDLSTQATWTSSDGRVVSINASGLATGTGTGNAQVTATVAGQTSAAASVTVTPATLVSLSFNPANPSVAAGTGTSVHVIGTFSDGTTQDLTSSATFSSSNPAVATVSSTGVVTGHLPGTSTITVQAAGQSSSFTVSVTAAVLQSLTITPANPAPVAKGTTEQFTATGTFSDGSTQDLSAQVLWTTSNPAVLTVNTQGLATGTGVGSASLSASYGGQSATSASVTVTPAMVASVTVSPASASITVGTTQQFTAAATLTDGSTQDVTASATWSSGNSAVATVNSSGLATGVAAGTTAIQAQINGMSSTGALTVTAASSPAPTLQSVVITPANATLALHATQQYTATGMYSDGSSQNLTTQVAWQSSTSVATVNSTGLATAQSAGQTQIWASLNGVSSMTTLTVSPATVVSVAVTPTVASLANGTSQQFTAVARMSDGSTLDISKTATWSSSNTTVINVNSTGLATASAVGNASVTAQSGAGSGSASVVVTPATPVSLQVNPTSVNLAAGNTLQLLTTAVFTDGTSQDVTGSATYSSSNNSVVSVDSHGKLTAAGPGTANVVVTLGGTTTNVAVNITNAALSSITVTPATVNLPAGLSQQLTATGNYTDGSTQDLTNSVTWTSSNPAVASVSSTGNVVVAAPGSVTVTAASGSVSGQATVNGSAATVSTVAVSPASVTLAAGQTQQFTATATMTDGTQQDATASAHWSVGDGTKASVSDSDGSKGLATATAAGSTTVMATVNGVSGTANLAVQPAVLTSLAVTPSPVTLPAGTTTMLTVTGHYSDGSTANLNNTTTWTTSSAAVATVDSTGFLHANANGNASVTATAQGVSANVPVTVTAAQLVSLAITPANPSLAAGQHTQLTATGTYTDGSTADLSTQVQWSSSAPATLTVSSSGLLNGLQSGSATVTASQGAVTASTAATVTPARLQSIAVQGSGSSFALGLSLQLTAIGTYTDGTTQDLSSQVTWSSSNPSVGVVSSAGIATGLTTGNFNAQASLGGVTGQTPVTVTSAILQSIAVTPANTTIVNVLGNSVQYTATGRFSDGSTQNLTNSVHWSIPSGVAVGSISSTGRFTPLGLGVGTVQATSGSISGSTGITVVSAL